MTRAAIVCEPGHRWAAVTLARLSVSRAKGLALAAALFGLMATTGAASAEDVDRPVEPTVASPTPAPAAPATPSLRRRANAPPPAAQPTTTAEPASPAGTPTATPATPPPLTPQQQREKAVLDRFAENLRRGRIAPDDNSPTDCVPIGLKETLNEIVQRFGSIVINSTYRSPRYNRYVGGARESFHLQCRAVDFTLVGRSQRNTQIMLRWLRARAGIGGIGIYDISGFIHIDDGPRRLWEQDEQWASTCRTLIGRDAERLVTEVVDPRARAAAAARREAEAREKAEREAATRTASAAPSDERTTPAAASTPPAATPPTAPQRRQTQSEERRAAMTAALEEATRRAPPANARRRATRTPAVAMAAPLRTAANLDIAARDRVRSFRAVGRPNTPQECMLFLVAQTEADRATTPGRRTASRASRGGTSARRSVGRSRR